MIASREQHVFKPAVSQVKSGAAERDLDAPLAALRHLDGDGAAALVLPLPGEQRARIAREACRRPGMFPAGVIAAVPASTLKGVLGRVMGPHAASAAWRCYVMQGSNV